MATGNSFFDNKITLKECIYIFSFLIGAFTQYNFIIGSMQEIVNNAKLEKQAVGYKLQTLSQSMDDLKTQFKIHVESCQPMYADKPKPIKIQPEN